MIPVFSRYGRMNGAIFGEQLLDYPESDQPEAAATDASATAPQLPEFSVQSSKDRTGSFLS